MGFSLKKYKKMEEEFSEHMNTFRARHNVLNEEELPAHRRPYVLFLKQMMKELEKLKEHPADKEIKGDKGKISLENRKSLILAGAMLVLINFNELRSKNSYLRRSLIINMGDWADTKANFDPNAEISKVVLGTMMAETIDFCESLILEHPYRREELYLNGQSPQIRKEHAFSKQEPMLLEFVTIANNLRANADTAKMEIALADKDQDNKNVVANDKKGWSAFSSWWSPANKEKEVLDQPFLPQLK